MATATKAKKKAAKKAAPKKAAAKKAVAKPKPSVSPARKIARQPSLPTMEDREMNALEEKALEYKEVQGERQALLAREVELKKDLLAMMRTAKKKTYSHNGVDIEIVPENERVKVHVDKKRVAGDEDEAEQEEVDSPPQPEGADHPAGELEEEEEEIDEEDEFEEDEEDEEDEPPFDEEASV